MGIVKRITQTLAGTGLFLPVFLVVVITAVAPYLGVKPIVPPLVAILLAFLTKEVMTSLFLGILAGAIYLAGNSPTTAFLNVVGGHFKNALADGDHAAILLFSAALAGMVSIMSRCGGTQGIVNYLKKYASGPRSAQVITWLMGLVIFFDDYANTLLVGNTMRPVSDKLKVSREKLSYIVDSTAAPVACLALISTWIGYEVSLIKDSLTRFSLVDTDAYVVFINSIPYRFYNIYTLIFVFLIAWLGRDFGPMLRAEARTRATGQVISPDATPLSGAEMDVQPGREVPQRAMNAILPIVMVILITLAGLYTTGVKSLTDEVRAGIKASLAQSNGAAPAVEPASGAGISEMDGKVLEAKVAEEMKSKNLRDIISKSDSFSVLLWASFAGSIMAALLAMCQGILSLQESAESWMAGVKSMVPAFIILILAWSIGKVCSDLKTGEFIADLVAQANLSPSLFPTTVFVVAAIVAFATGTSWGTMAILIPIVTEVVNKMVATGAIDKSGDLFLPILFGSLSSVLAGASFGDHCSPISDTTIMSSMASGSDHLDHVKTQMPYALTAALIAILFGVLPAGYGVSPYLLAIPAIGAMIFIIRFFGKDPEKETWSG